jgi:hypothetical protein
VILTTLYLAGAKNTDKYLPSALFEGVGAGDGFEAGSSILILDDLFRTSFQGFFCGGGVSAALRLPAWVLEDSAP